jgi:transposase
MEEPGWSSRSRPPPRQRRPDTGSLPPTPPRVRRAAHLGSTFRTGTREHFCCPNSRTAGRAGELAPAPVRRRPAKPHADKGYDYGHLRRWLRGRGITHRIARRSVESSTRLGRHRWTIERTMSWLAGCRRLHRRYERKAEHFLAFTSIACTLICYRRLTK